MNKILLFMMAALIFTNESYAVLSNSKLSYTGRLVRSNGQPVAGPVNLVFRLYEGANASESCQQTVTGVSLNNGVFNVELEFPNSNASDQCHNATNNLLDFLVTADANNHDVKIEVTDTTNNSTYSKQLLNAAPYSLITQKALGLSQLGATDGQFLKWDDTLKKWVASSVTGTAGGTVNSIVAGSGLTGGTINTSGTIAVDIDTTYFQFATNKVSLKDASISTNKLVDNSITASKIADGQIAKEKLANITPYYILQAAPVSGWQAVTFNQAAAGGNCSLGQILFADGTGGFTCGSDANSGGTIAGVTAGTGLTGGGATGTVSIGIANSGVGTTQIANNAVTNAKINDVDVSKIGNSVGSYFVYQPNNAACSNNQVLKWDNTNTRWICANDLDTNSGGTIGTVNAGAGLTGGGSSSTITVSIAASGVTNSLIANNAVDGNKIAASSIGASHLNTGIIDDSHISATAAIADTKLATITTAGKVNGSAISGAISANSLTTNAQGALVVGPYNTAVGNTGEVRLKELAANGANYVGLKSPDSIATNLIWTMPNADGSSGQVLMTSGTGTLSWVSIGAASINPGDIGTTQLATAAVTNDKIATGAVEANLIATGTITNTQISSTANISDSKLATITTAGKVSGAAIYGSITASGYTANNQAGFVLDPYNTAAGNTSEIRFKELAANGVNYVGFKSPDTIASNKVWTLPAADGGGGQVIATDGLGVLGWTYIGSSNISAGAIGTTQLAAGAVTSSIIASGAVGSTQIAANAVGSAQLAASSVQAANIATGTITDSHLANATITLGKLAAITSGYIVVGNGTTATAVPMSGDATFTATGLFTIANNAITTGKISNQSITNVKLSGISSTCPTYAILSVDGLGNFVCYDTATLNTSNYIAKWNGSTFVSSNIYQTATGSVGIGTSTPSSAFAVNGSITTSEVKTRNYNLAAADSLTMTQKVTFTGHGSGKIIVANLHTSNARATYAEFDILFHGGAGYAPILVSLKKYNSVFDARMYYDSATEVLTLLLQRTSGASTFAPSVVLLGNFNIASEVYDTSSPAGTELTDWKYAQVDNYIGLGTNTPSSMLDVMGSSGNGSDTWTGSNKIRFTNYKADATGPYLQLVKSRSASVGVLSTTIDNDAIGAIYFDGVNSSNTEAAAVKIVGKQDGVSTATYVPGQLSFFTSTGSASAQQRMTITSTGSIGLNTTSPAYLLDVNGTARFTGSVTFPGGVSSSGTITASTYSDATNLLYQINGQQMMKVNSTGVVVGSTGNAGALYLARATDGATSMSISSNSTQEMQYSNSSGGGFHTWQTNYGGTAERMRLSNKGYLGIGTTTPSGALDVVMPAVSTTAETIAKFSVSDDTNSYLTIENGTTANSIFYPRLIGTNSATTAPALYLGAETSDDIGSTSIMYYKASINGSSTASVRPLFRWFNYSTAVMTITASGYLGVGANSPISILTVSDSTPYVTISDNQEKLWNSGDLIGAVNFRTTDSSGIGPREVASIKIVDDGSSSNTTMRGAMSFYTSVYNGADVEQMRISSTGSVGIGTSTPTATLDVNTAHVDSAGETVAKFSVDDDATSFIKISNGTSANGVFNPRLRGSSTASTGPGLFLGAEVINDVGSTPIMHFRSAISGSVTASVRPLFQWANYTTDVMTIDSNGYIGIGTSSPTVALDIHGTAAGNSRLAVTRYSTSLSGYPVIYLSKSHNATLDTETTTLDTEFLGSIEFKGRTTSGGEVTGARILGQQMGSSTATYVPAQLDFRVSDGTSGSSSAMVISKTGNVGIGAASPSELLHIGTDTSVSTDRKTFRIGSGGYGAPGAYDTSSNGDKLILFHNTVSNYDGRIGIGAAQDMWFKSTGSGASQGIFRWYAGSAAGLKMTLSGVGDLTITGCLQYNGGTAGTCLSDKRLKKDVRNFDLGLDKLIGVQPVFYKYNGLGGQDEDRQDRLGVIAQDVEKVAPELVEFRELKLNPNDKKMTKIKTVKYDSFLFMLINSIKELYAKWIKHDNHLIEINRKIASLEEENKKLREENKKQQALLCKKFGKEFCQ